MGIGYARRRLSSALLIGLLPAVAQSAPATQKKPAAKSRAAAAKTLSLKATYEAMSDAERRALQSDLLWAGDFYGMANGEFDDRSIVAVKAFQQRNKFKPTGIVNPHERALLASAAKARQDSVGWRIVDDAATGMRLGLPAKLVPQSGPGKSGSRWFSAQGQVQVETFRERTGDLPALFEQRKKEPPQRQVEFSVSGPDFFVVSGLQGLKKFYVRAHAVGGEVRGLTILYDQATEGMMGPATIAMASALMPVSGAPPQQAKRKVEYGTGIVVSSAGHILTDAQIVDDCQVIVAGGLGAAERIAEDRGLALLRVYAAGELASAPLADGELAVTVTMLGIADPQAQGGGVAVTQVSARMAAATRTIEPAPVPGFAGAAAIDNQGRVAGLVTLKAPVGAGSSAAQANVIPADSIRKFLAAASVAPSNGTDVKASLVRVICVRK
jgi:peptidoglycan hydrolase-like protein with peptidoglycan-binding domain